MKRVLACFVFLAGCGSKVDNPGQTPAVDMAIMVDLIPENCSNGTLDPGETDLDCGGVCPPCADEMACMVGTDCKSGICTDGACAVPTCMDGVKNGIESDVDCGHVCPVCDDGKKCDSDGDCRSHACTAGICTASPCTDGKKDGKESDVDCGGGDCPACDDGKVCFGADDCKSLLCAMFICTSDAPPCLNNKKDGLETDIDCGGGMCPRCGEGKSCLINDDCQSGQCGMDICQPMANCMDLMKNGTETDVDCGGGFCPKCPAGKQCLADSDCTSGSCVMGVCGM